MKLNFSSKEQICINYLVQCLIKADGLILPEENVCWNTISLKMRWDENNKVLLSDNYSIEDAIDVLSEMDDQKKRFAVAFFYMIILADGVVVPEETALIKEISEKASLPQITIENCATILEEYLK